MWMSLRITQCKPFSIPSREVWQPEHVQRGSGAAGPPVPRGPHVHADPASAAQRHQDGHPHDLPLLLAHLPL